MAEDNKGYYCSKVKFYFLDINSDGEINTSHLPVLISGAYQSLESLYPSNTNAHYYNDIEVCLKDTELKNEYKTDKIYTDNTRKGKYCLHLSTDIDYERNHWSPIADNFLLSNSGFKYRADIVIIPTKVTVDNNFAGIVDSVKLLSWQEFADNGSHWKDLDENVKLNGKYALAKYRLPLDLASSITSIKSIDKGALTSPRKVLYPVTSLSYQYNTKEFDIEWEEAKLSYLPKTTIDLYTLTHTGSSYWGLSASPDSNEIIHNTRITIPDSAMSLKYGNQVTTAFIPSTYYNELEIQDYSTKSNFWFRQFQLKNTSTNANYRAPAYINISLTGEKVKYLELRDVKYKEEHYYGTFYSVESFKIYNPNKFPVRVYVPNKRLKETSIFFWKLGNAETENTFRYYGEIPARSTSDEIELSDWPYWSDMYGGAYFLLKNGNLCKVYATIAGGSDKDIDYRYTILDLEAE